MHVHIDVITFFSRASSLENEWAHSPEVIWICSIFIVVNLTDYFLLVLIFAFVAAKLFCLKLGYFITQYTYNIVMK